MKKTFSLVLTFILFLLASCGGDGPFTTTASMLIVTEKSHSSDYKVYWIKAYDPNNQTEEQEFKIIVKEEMVWNLIEENKEYFTSYAKEGDKTWILEQIEHID